MHAHTPLTHAHTYLYKHSLAPTHLLIHSHMHPLHTFTNTYTFTLSHIYTLSHANTHLYTGAVTSHTLNTHSHMRIHTYSAYTHSHTFLLQPTFFLEAGPYSLSLAGKGQRKAPVGLRRWPVERGL